MAKVTFTAWKTKTQLLEVRSEFYPPSMYDGPDKRSHACATVEAWKLRGNVPHHVEATALLTDAILHDDGQRNSIFSIRATYSAAFCRFVTGLVDTKVTGPRRTMFQRAMDLGLPASFVELRHEATHREPPSLVVLRKATQRSLEWLWDNYWANIDLDKPAVAPAVVHDSSIPLPTALSQVLQEFMQGSDSRPTQKKRKHEQEDAIANRLLEICSASQDGVDAGLKVLSTLLLDRKFLINAQRELGDSMDATFDKWDLILQHVTGVASSFMLVLSEQLIHHLALVPSADSPGDAQAEGVFLWLEHLLTSPAWDSQRSLLPQGYFLAVCDDHPTHWAKLLSKTLHSQRQNEAAAVSGLHPTACASVKKQSQHDPLDTFSKRLQEHGWGFAEKWDSRPLGIISSN